MIFFFQDFMFVQSEDRLRLTSAGLAVTAGATATTAGGLSSSLISGLLTVVVAAGVAVTVSFPFC